MAIAAGALVTLGPASAPQLRAKHGVRAAATPRHPPEQAALRCEPAPVKGRTRFLLDATFVLRKFPHNLSGWYLESANVPDHFVTLVDQNKLRVLPYLRQSDFDQWSAFELAQEGPESRVTLQAMPDCCMQMTEDLQLVMSPLGASDPTLALFQLSLSDVPRERLRPDRPVGTLQTRWGRELLCREDLDQVHSEHPRPMLVRTRPYGDWRSLNGLWRFAIVPVPSSGRGFPPPSESLHYGDILVPFCAESQLSGVQRFIGATNYLWYEREVPTPTLHPGSRLILHFGAVDWEATVYVNSVLCGQHRGGYAPFAFDITSALINDRATATIAVRVWDPTSAGTQPRGKQVNTPSGIWYTPTTGIWQTVWLETAPAVHISSVECVTRLQQGLVEVRVQVAAPGQFATALRCCATAKASGQPVAEASAEFVAPAGESRLSSVIVNLSLPSARLWSPDSPFLYDLDLRLVSNGTDTVDAVQSYFAVREVAVERHVEGVPRVMLNGRPVFMLGCLDQGYWPDGLLTPPCEEAMLFDLELAKRSGMNAVRKHVKAESQRWYAACDRLGLLVWQDMPSGDRYASWDPYGTHFGTEDVRPAESMANFQEELVELIRCFRAHPCIVCWVLFNEGWGQANTRDLTTLLEAEDVTRLVNAASGGNDLACAPGSMVDWHFYPGPLPSKQQARLIEAAAKPGLNQGFPKLDQAGRALVLGEYGGLGLPKDGHTWSSVGNWGYHTLQSVDQLTDHFIGMTRTLLDLARKRGLCAAIYTQATDVEMEVNGLVTYDREVEKLNVGRVAAVNRELVECLNPSATL